jgi:hypothetical protein
MTVKKGEQFIYITGSPGGKPPRKNLYRDKNVEETGPDQQVYR